MDAAPTPALPAADNQPAAHLPGLAPLAVIQSYEDLLAVVRSRMIALNITFEVLDQASGVCGGYSAKLIAGRTRRRFGNVSLPAVLGALGLTPRIRPRVNRAA